MTRPRKSRRKIERIPIISREHWLNVLRPPNIGGSEVPALFRVCPHETALGLFAKKSGIDMGPDEDNKAMRRGRILESAVAAAFAEEHQTWSIRKATDYLVDRKLKLGCTPDFYFTDDRGRHGIMQAKSVDPSVFRRSWTDETPPFHITLQTLTEAMLDDADYGVICALVGFHCDLHEYVVPRHAGAERRIRDAVRSFWKNLAEGKPPNVDYANDGALMAVLYPRERPGLVVDLRSDNALPGLLDEREHLKEEIKEAVARVETIDCEIKSKMADAEAALVRDWRMTLREQHRKEFTVKANSFRVLRVAREEAKKDAA